MKILALLALTVIFSLFGYAYFLICKKFAKKMLKKITGKEDKKNNNCFPFNILPSSSFF